LDRATEPVMPNDAVGSGELKLTAGEFRQISDLAYERFGLDLRRGKEALVAARLGKKLRKLGFQTFAEYHSHVLADSSGCALVELIDALTTNHTSFLRERAHFEFLARAANQEFRKISTLRVWSAACSSGEEPYSIAMTLLEGAGAEAAAKVKIKATDISTRVLERGHRGVYAAERFAGIGVPLMQRYLLKGRNESAGTYRFKSEVRSMIEFQHLNLMETLPEGYRCSVIFCRNIMIYFDKSTQEDLVRRLSDRLEEGGYLFIGHSESLNSISHDFAYLSPATYRKPGGAGNGQIGRRR